jgi:uracil-DNA glycosylase family 4
MQSELQAALREASNLKEVRQLCERSLGAEVAEGEQLVFGEGSHQATLMIIGEAPGVQEAKTGRPFVGQAGRLLEKLLQGIDLKRNEVYISNVLKTHPPNNRRPSRVEVERELPILKRQLELLGPKLLALLGSTALQALVDPKGKITRLRGHWVEVAGIPALVTYHPAAALRDDSRRALLEEDFAALGDRLSTQGR